ncbi:MAG: HD domain-containing protein [Fusobacteria bacterium]|nr:HD domain-containing protein [Fusobacteriota bacterium]
MFYRLTQAWRAIFIKVSKEDRELALSILKETWEREIFLSLSEYDQNHSIRIVKEIILEVKTPSKLLLRLSLLHDCGKSSSLTLIDRALYSKFKISRKEISKHSYLGYLKVKQWDLELAELISKHHSEGEDNTIETFQYYDNRN